MVSTIVSTALVPLRGGQTDSVADALSRRTRTVSDSFNPGESQDELQGNSATSAAGSRAAAATGTLPQLLRRRTDRGEDAQTSIQIPPHLERRRAWREAFGLNTWHTQQLAQDDGEEDAPSRDATVTAVRAYRSTAWRGRLDLDLAQRISVTV